MAGVPWKNPVATASGTFQYAAVRWFYDVSQLGAVTTRASPRCHGKAIPAFVPLKAHPATSTRSACRTQVWTIIWKTTCPSSKAINATVHRQCGRPLRRLCEVVSKLNDSPADSWKSKRELPNVSAGYERRH